MHNKTTCLLIVLFVLVGSFALVTVTLAAANWGSRNQTPPPPLGSSLPEGGGSWVVRAYFDDPQMVATLAQTKEPWDVNAVEGYIVIDVDNAQEYLWLQWQGFRLEVDETRTKTLNQPRVFIPGQTLGIPGYPCYRTVEETYLSASQIATDYPDLASWVDIGDSWEKFAPGGLPGYDLMVLQLTNKNIPGPKPKFFAMSEIHAREYATAELNTRFAEYLVENYGKDPDVTWILDYNEVHLLLMTNPDGRKKAETGLLWRKNTDSDDGCGDPNSWGTDLNRNFDFEWNCCGGSSPSPCDETYHGPSAASEPETQAVMNYVTSQFPDQRPDDLTTPAPITSTGVFLDIHSFSELVLWPWGFTVQPFNGETPTSLSPNDPQLRTLGRKFAYFNNYSPDQQIWYDVDGATNDFAYGRLGLAGYVFEIGTNFFQDCGTFENTIYPDNLQALLYAAKVSRTPYMTPAGPDTLSVLAAPGATAPGYMVELTANVDGTRYNNTVGVEPITNTIAAEYYIDVPPWSVDPAPFPYPMSAADGAFDETIEEVIAPIDTSEMSTGRHTVFVRGQDADGDWGTISAKFLFVVDPDIAPELEGNVRDYGTNAPLEATVTAGLLEAITNPATGFYHTFAISGSYTITAIAPGHIISTVMGVKLEDYEKVQQSFTLRTPCTVFYDNIEDGNQGWTAQTPWGITTGQSHSPTHSWTDSPAGNYSNNRNISLTSQTFDLSGTSGAGMSFWHRYDTESGWDFGYVEYSDNGGGTWTAVASYSGVRNDWEQVFVSLPALDGQPDAKIRFRFTSDSNTVADGWYIDNIELYGSGTECIPPLAPTADFTTNSPVLPGDTVRFTNMTEGSNPLTYAWDFGDGAGNSTESDPFYTYAITGTYVVTLDASNSEGSDSITHTVVVEPCEVLTAVTLTLKTSEPYLVGQQVEFEVDIAPDDATKSYNYAMDFGDGSDPLTGSTSDDPLALAHTYLLPGEFLTEVQVDSCGTQPLTDSVALLVSGEDGFIVMLPMVILEE